MWKRIIRVCIAVFIVVISLIVVMFLWFMFILKRHDESVEYGENRYNELTAQGITVDHQIYTAGEISADATKKEVNLQYFPGGSRDRFVLICPGGAYTWLGENEQSAVAAKFNEHGITAFVLQYRVGKNLKKDTVCLYDDVGYALQYIFGNAAEFNISTENYALCGFSASGHLVTSFVLDTILGYQKYNIPKPQFIIAGYPYYGYGYSDNDAHDLLAQPYTEDEAESLKIWDKITEKFPASFVFHGTADKLVSYEENTVRMDSVLMELGVLHEVHLYEGMQHGFGIGKDSVAESWVADAVRFWQNSVK